MILRLIILTIAASLFAPSLSAASPDREERLKEAISLANQGQSEESISLFIRLAEEDPNDHRVFLSLGLVYRSTGMFDEAITAIERSVTIKPTQDAYYSLGLLFEAKAVDFSTDSTLSLEWLRKALSAWNRFLGLNPEDTRRVEVASRHLRRINAQIARISAK